MVLLSFCIIGVAFFVILAVEAYEGTRVKYYYKGRKEGWEACRSMVLSYLSDKEQDRIKRLMP